jgi:5-methyltetrahydropteroyltriglutamate--homocysteine methyltransferase
VKGEHVQQLTDYGEPAVQAVGAPFRADHVGSLLRPERLKAARERLLGEHSAEKNLAPHQNEELRGIEDECIREAVAMQERIGLKAATDGEFRRRSWWLELILNWTGFDATREGGSPITWKREDGTETPFSTLSLTGRISWRPSPVVRAFEFLKANTLAVPKVTLPAPTMVHGFLGGDRAIRESLYGDVDAFWEDVVAAYRQELASLVAAGARYIQMDDTYIAFLCDPTLREMFRGWGTEPDEMLRGYGGRINQALEGLPDGVTVTLHQCRGNREGQWAAAGGYDPVADVLFNQIDVDGYFLEYDTPRAGSFEPLRLLPKGKTVVLGLVSTKTPELESADHLKRRVDEAARFAPIGQLALSPQCGFASSVRGNPVTAADQEAKLARIVEVAREVWPDA